jgi:hypothetical protein
MPSPKAGLWETKIVKNIVDGKDMTAQINDAMAKMQARLAQMTPEQRAMVESHMNGMAAGGSNSVRVCISPAMAAKHAFGGDPQGHCPGSSYDVSGNKVSFSINCTHDGRTTVGTGQAIMNGDSISTHVDLKTTDSKGTHTMLADTQMSYLGSNCQGIKPFDEK